MHSDNSDIGDALDSFLTDKSFPCVAARASAAKGDLKIMTAMHLACPADDDRILKFIYGFIKSFRKQSTGFHSAAIIFKGPEHIDEKIFDAMLWQRLQALSDLDAKKYKHDARVSADPSSSQFSFSLGEEAFFILALHPASNRPARRFQYPVLIFNPHVQFERMKAAGSYEKMKAVIRKRDLAFSGSLNPMLRDFGEYPETFQYSGAEYEPAWQCPFKNNHG